MRKFEIVSTYKNEDVKLPIRQTAHSAGYDLASIKEIVIKPGEIQMIPTGLKAQIPEHEALFIYPRSSLGLKKHLMMSNGVGVVDADYYNNPKNEGHLMVPLYNFGDKDVVVEKGERVAQGIFMSYEKTVDDVSADIKRSGGFGSSGDKS